MKISMISEHASPLAALGGVDAGGQNVHVAALSEHLADLGHDVTVFTRRDSHRTKETTIAGRGITVVNVTAGPQEYLPKDEFLPLMPAFGRGIADYWANHPDKVPDIVHSHFWMSGIAARTALDTARMEDTPLVHTFHALGTVKRRHQGAADTSPVERSWMEPQVGHLATRIVATCDDEVKELEAMGIGPATTSVIPCGVDLGLFQPAGDAEEPTGAWKVVSVGRLVPRKGMELLIRALPFLFEQGFSNVELHIVGGGGEESDLRHDPEAQRLQELAVDLGVSDHVFLRGQVPRDQIPSILRGADVVACTPWYEPFGIVPLEAMACGTPVLATHTGGLGDTVVDGVTGVHVPPQDSRAIANSLAALFSNPPLMQKMGINGLKRVHAHYSWPTVAQRTEQVYLEALEQTHQSATNTDNNGADSATVTALCDDGVLAHLDSVNTAVSSLREQSAVIGWWGRELATRLKAGQRLFTAGNGGSAAEAQHLSSELVGRFQDERRAFSAMSLCADPSAVTAISNDYGYENVFSRQLEGLASPGDILLLLTTSGKSENLLRAAETAREMGVEVWGLTGPAPNPLSLLCDELIAVDAKAPNVQEAHLMAIHGICRSFDASIARTTPATATHSLTPILREVH